MKLSAALLLPVLLLSSVQASAVQQISNPLFWKAEKNGHVAYLLGTVHFRVQPDEIPKSVWKALSLSATVMVERNLTAKNQMAQPQANLGAGALAGRAIPEKEFRFLYSVIQQNWGSTLDISQVAAMDVMSANYFSQIKPADVMAQMKDNTIDQQVALRAEKNSKTIIELDIEAKTDFSNIISASELTKDIDEEMKRSPGQIAAEADASINKIVSNYRAGVCAEETSDVNQQMGAKTAKTLVTDRNTKWLKIIDSKVSSAPTPTFIAVGCAHLNESDPASVLNGLKSLGYKITRLKPK